MSQLYNLEKVKEIAQGDVNFVKTIVSTFLEEVPKDIAILEQSYIENDYEQVYQSAHKLKPTIDLFGLEILDEVIIIQDWGKYKKINKCIKHQMSFVLNHVNQVVLELKEKYN